jgi:prepilin-type N-terminal cleavage/methylation domain-containing protein
VTGLGVGAASHGAGTVGSEEDLSITRETSQGGFSLVELMVAMVVTLVISGSIYGLLTSSQNAFRREPEVTDRQQNIRIAMDLVQKDIAVAGQALPSVMQMFTRTDITSGALLDGLGPMGPNGIRADELEVFGNDGTCPTMDVCSDGGVTVFTVEKTPACFTFPSLVLLYNEDCVIPCPAQDATCSACYKFGFATQPGPGGGSGGCNANGHVNFQPGQAPAWNPPGGKDPVTDMGQISVFRWWIANDAQGVPNLWRSTTGRDAATNAWLQNNGGDTAPRLVARGIEDMQVQYLPGGADPNVAAAWLNSPPVRDPNNDATVVSSVRVTLTARSEAFGLQGESRPTAGARQALRGSLTSVTSPRMALTTLSNSGSGLWR